MLMHAFSKAATVLLGVIAMAAGSASVASATCVDLPNGLQRSRAIPLGTLAPGNGHLSDRSPSGMGGGDEDASIVGMWQFVFISHGNDYYPLNIPDLAPLDAGYSQWHGDGTEIMNSSRDPVTSSFCLGVWESVGHRTYRLNHYAISWDNTGTFCTPVAPATNCMVGPANIREEVTVGPHGDTYTGSVTIDQYDNVGNLMVHLTGSVEAQRITVD
jgi:hypothetical protein